MIKKSIAASPFLVSLASLSYLYLQASFVASVDQVLRPMLVVWCLLLLLLWPIRWLTRDWDLTFATLTVVVIGLFSGRYLADIVFAGTYVIAQSLFLVSRPLKIKFTLTHVFVIINIMSGTVILLCAFWLYARWKLIPASYFENLERRRAGDLLHASDSGKPDIYYIILDGYGQADTLQEFYGYDNSAFTRQLMDFGFVLPKHSHSNYPKTVLSVASTLNMDYIASFAPGLERTGFWWLMAPWIDQSRVRTSLENIGYTSISISTDWSITDNQTTDIYFQSHPVILNDYERYFLSSTALSVIQPAFQNVMSVGTFDMHRQTQLYNFSALSRISHIPGPKFVFAHILLPHPPFVFQSDGAPRDPSYGFALTDANDIRETKLQYQFQYISQVQFLNKQLIPVIESILQNSAQPPVIILQADHGPGMMTDFSTPSNTCMKERFASFSGYYLPGVDKNAIPEDVTPVNLFRIIFNEYFDAKLPILKNASYFPVDPIGIYDMEEVTSAVESRANCLSHINE